MGVYIPSMEMPTVCIHGDWFGNCPMDRTWCAQRFAPKGMTMGQIAKEQQDKLPDWCPLRPLPEKHGRLIDLDALLDRINGEERPEMYDGMDEVFWIQKCLEEATTIVEAEGD